jgi:hypothetical protein
MANSRVRWQSASHGLGSEVHVVPTDEPEDPLAVGMARHQRDVLDGIEAMGEADDYEEEEEEEERDPAVLELTDKIQADALRRELSEYIGSLQEKVDEQGHKLVDFPHNFNEMLQVMSTVCCTFRRASHAQSCGSKYM